MGDESFDDSVLVTETAVEPGPSPCFPSAFGGNHQNPLGFLEAHHDRSTRDRAWDGDRMSSWVGRRGYLGPHRSFIVPALILQISTST